MSSDCLLTAAIFSVLLCALLTAAFDLVELRTRRGGRITLFRQYAEQALRQAVQSKNEKEQLALIELVRTWTQAAEATSQGAACRG